LVIRQNADLQQLMPSRHILLSNTYVVNVGTKDHIISVRTSLWLVDCTPAICCEKCEVTTYSSQKMSLKAAKFPPRPTRLPGRGWH